MFSKSFASKNQLPGFYVSETLVENRLMKTFYCKIKTFDCDSNNEIKNKIILPDLGFLEPFMHRGQKALPIRVQ